MKIFKSLKNLFIKINENHGYTTPIQDRYKKGDKCIITKEKLGDNIFPVGTEVTILETGRHDYLVENKGKRMCVYQFELELKEEL
jgi:hypothetical protein